MRCMAVAVVKVVDMVLVLDRGVSAVRTMLVLMAFGLVVTPAGDPAAQGVVGGRDDEERYGHQDDRGARGGVDVESRRHPAHGAEGPIATAVRIAARKLPAT